MNEKDFNALFEDEEFTALFNARVEKEKKPLMENRNQILEEKRILNDDYKSMKEELSFFREQAEREKERQRQDYRRTSLDTTYEKHGFKKELTPLIESYLEKNGLTMSEDRVLLMGEGEDARPLDDWLKDFSETDQGKMLIPAGINTGVGAHGSPSGRIHDTKPDPSRMSKDQLLNELIK